VLGRGRQVEVGNIFDIRFNFGLLATISPGEDQTVHGLLSARQGSQVPVEEQDKDERTKMVKEYLTNSVLPRDRAKADWVVTMSNHCILVDNVLWYKIKTKTRITMAV
jgi:hypothetical protein